MMMINPKDGDDEKTEKETEKNGCEFHYGVGEYS
jgi:hypothetical protein